MHGPTFSGQGCPSPSSPLTARQNERRHPDHPLSPPPTPRARSKRDHRRRQSAVEILCCSRVDGLGRALPRAYVLLLPLPARPDPGPQPHLARHRPRQLGLAHLPRHRHHRLRHLSRPASPGLRLRDQLLVHARRPERGDVQRDGVRGAHVRLALFLTERSLSGLAYVHGHECPCAGGFDDPTERSAVGLCGVRRWGFGLEHGCAPDSECRDAFVGDGDGEYGGLFGRVEWRETAMGSTRNFSARWGRTQLAHRPRHHRCRDHILSAT